MNGSWDFGEQVGLKRFPTRMLTLVQILVKLKIMWGQPARGGSVGVRKCRRDGDLAINAGKKTATPGAHFPKKRGFLTA